eukprot:TRINITY_DN73696_c0_g1_i1.p1 TRINITY_DN73696_c0_g1~~TRINITY_DN73696_c0_g1_i1.p1  ORF type:complete len:497 (+),score=52.27 TRINITY_DN73696_c0_g1_i1:81-1571(+)
MVVRHFAGNLAVTVVLCLATVDFDRGESEVRVCDETALPASCRHNGQKSSTTENITIWTRLLRLECEHCWDSSCKLSAELLDVAEIVASEPTPSVASACLGGVLSATLVLLQNDDFRHQYGRYFDEWRDNFGSVSRDLSPYPFNTEAWGWYMNGFTPLAIVRSCDIEARWTVDTREPTKLLVTLDSPLPPEICPYNFHDGFLIERCRRRKRSAAWFKADDLVSVDNPAHLAIQWACPHDYWMPRGDVAGQMHVLRKYRGKSCGMPEGSWGWDIRVHLKCIFISVGELLGFRSGESVLDWGSGCGWFLTWAEVFYGIRGFGIEMARSSAMWARRHALGSFCHYGDLDLRWVPDESFHYVTSFWSLYHLQSKEEQCGVIGQLVQKLRVGGRMWLGGNCPAMDLLWPNEANVQGTCMSSIDVLSCLDVQAESSAWRRHGIAGSFEALPDEDLFRAFQNRHKQERGDYLFWGSSWSAIITRVAVSRRSAQVVGDSVKMSG